MSMLRVIVHAMILLWPVVLLGPTAARERAPVIAAVAVLLLLLAEVETRARMKNDPSRAGAPGTRLALASALGLLGATWAALICPWSSGAWQWLGVPLALVGIALRGAAMRALGDSFTSEIIAAPGRPLVTHGIYARLRHPSDLGLFLLAMGVALLGGSVVSAAIVAIVLVPSIAIRIAREDRVLALAHGEAHALYRRSAF